MPSFPAMKPNHSLQALTPPRNPGVRRALLLGHAIGLGERPVLITEHEADPRHTAYVLLALAALSIVMLIAVA